MLVKLILFQSDNFNVGSHPMQCQIITMPDDWDDDQSDKKDDYVGHGQANSLSVRQIWCNFLMK